MKRRKQAFLTFLLAGGILLAGCGGNPDPRSEIIVDQTNAPRIEAGASEEAETEKEEKPEQVTEEESAEEEKTEEDAAAEEAAKMEAAIEEAVEDKLQGMTLEERVWQLFLVTPEELTDITDTVTRAGETTRNSLQAHMVGGIVYGTRNLYEKKQVRSMLSSAMGFGLKDKDLPLFLMIDEGWTVYEVAEDDARIPFWDEALNGLGAGPSAGERLQEIFAQYGIRVSEPLDRNDIDETGAGSQTGEAQPAAEGTETPEPAQAAEAAVSAIEAGNDMLLKPNDMDAAHEGLMNALREGRLTEERLDDSVRRILRQKYRWMLTNLNGVPDKEEGEYFYYADAQKHWHYAYLEPDVPRSALDLTLLTNDAEGVSCQDPDVELMRGIDVSSHNGTIDFEAVKAAGIDFVIIRAVFRGYGEEGSLNTDTKLHENLAAAQSAGLKTGVYVFSQAINEAEAVEEAEQVLKELDGTALDLPIVFDPESIKGDEARTDDVSGEQFTENCIAFCERIRSAGYEPMIYSNMIWEAEMLELSRLKDYLLWYADYENKPQTPYRFTFWQHSEEGSVNGVDGPVDLDVWFREAGN